MKRIVLIALIDYAKRHCLSNQKRVEMDQASGPEF